MWSNPNDHFRSTEWLSQNWIWIAFAVGFILLMRRGGIGCGMGHRHSRHVQPIGDHGDGEPPSTTGSPVSGGVANPPGRPSDQPHMHRHHC